MNQESKTDFRQGLNSASFEVLHSTAEAVPFPNRL